MDESNAMKVVAAIIGLLVLALGVVMLINAISIGGLMGILFAIVVAAIGAGAVIYGFL